MWVNAMLCGHRHVLVKKMFLVGFASPPNAFNDVVFRARLLPKPYQLLS